MEDVIVRLTSLRINGKENQVKLGRLVRNLWGMLGWVWFVSRKDKVVDKVTLRLDEKGRLVGGPSGQVRLILEL